MPITTSDLKDLVEMLRASKIELEAAGEASHLVETAAVEIEKLSADGDLDKVGERIQQLLMELSSVRSIRPMLVRGVGKSGLPSASLQRTEDMVVFVQKFVEGITKSTLRQVDSTDQSGTQG
jgi:hypothetical protein